MKAACYAIPGAYDAELDEGMRRLQQTLARVPGDKYPVAANEGVFEMLPVLRESFYGLENWLHANWFRFGASTLVNDLLRQIAWLETGKYAARYDFSES